MTAECSIFLIVFCSLCLFCFLDFALGQFRFLQRLLFTYGHWNYRRIATLICYIFYKASFMVWTVFFLGIYSTFSGSILYLDWAFQLYNVAYTAFPILIFAVFDKDLNGKILEETPEIYAWTRGDTYFNRWIFSKWMLFGLLHASLCFFIPWYAFADSPVSASGIDSGIWPVGLCIFTCVVIVTNIKLAFLFQSWTWLHAVAIGIGIFIYCVSMLIFNFAKLFDLGGASYVSAVFYLFGLIKFWLVVLLVVASCFSLDLIHESYMRLFGPISPLQIHVEAERLGIKIERQVEKNQNSIELYSATQISQQNTRKSITSGQPENKMLQIQEEAFGHEKHKKKNSIVVPAGIVSKALDKQFQPVQP